MSFNLLLIVFKCPLATSTRGGDGKAGGGENLCWNREMVVAGDELPLHPRLGCDVTPPDGIPFPPRAVTGHTGQAGSASSKTGHLNSSSSSRINSILAQ